MHPLRPASAGPPLPPYIAWPSMGMHFTIIASIGTTLGSCQMRKAMHN